MRPYLTPEAEREIERGFDMDRRAWQLLDLICAEFESDPNSVACFDMRIVTEAIALVKERRKRNDIGSPFI